MYFVFSMLFIDAKSRSDAPQTCLELHSDKGGFISDHKHSKGVVK